MTDVRLDRGARAKLGRVEGDLIASRDVEIDSEAGGRVVVTGRAMFDGNATIRADFECQSLKAEEGVVVAERSLTVADDLSSDDAQVEVRGPLRAGRIDVDRSLLLGADAEAREIEIGGSLEARGNLTAHEVSVGGRFVTRGKLTSERVEVGGFAELGEVDLKRLAAGGRARIASGRISDRIEIGGSFECTGPLEFGDIEVGGTIEIASGRGRRMEVGGSLSTVGDLTFERLELGGVGRIGGNLAGDQIEVGGVLAIKGSVTLRGSLEVGGTIEVGETLAAESVEVGGSISARVAHVAEHAEIGGSLRTREGFKARVLELSKRAEAMGPLVADRVVLERKCRADMVCGRWVQIGADCEVQAVCGESVEVGNHSRVGRIEYLGIVEPWTGRHRRPAAGAGRQALPVPPLRLHAFLRRGKGTPASARADGPVRDDPRGREALPRGSPHYAGVLRRRDARRPIEGLDRSADLPGTPPVG